MSGVRVQGRTTRDERLTERWNVTRRDAGPALRLRPPNDQHASPKRGPPARHSSPADADIRRHSSSLSLQVTDASRWFVLRRTGIIESANSEAQVSPRIDRGQGPGPRPFPRGPGPFQME